jgi:hypothetical protein
MAVGLTKSDSVSSLAVDGAGNVLAGGTFTGSTTNLGSANVTSAGGSDGLAVKFDTNGTLLWAKALGGTQSDSVSSLAVDGAGNVLAGGTFRSSTTNLGSANVTSAGSDDVLIAKFAANGTTLWAKALGGSSSDQLSSLSVDSAGNILTTGSFWNGITNLGSFNLQGGHSIIKFDPSGLVVETQRVGPFNLLDIQGFTCNSENVLVWGYSYGVTAIGNAGLPLGSFALSWPAITLITPAKKPVVPFSWAQSFAEGTGSVALGTGAIAQGDSSLALGSGNAFGAYSLALGSQSTSTGLSSTALGGGSSASGSGSLAAGRGSVASGQNSIALGQSKAIGTNSTSWGQQSEARGLLTTASGQFTIAQASHSLVIGRNNIAQGNPTQWIPTDDIFVIGNGASSAARSNAFAVQKNGNATFQGVVRCAPGGDIPMYSGN